MIKIAVIPIDNRPICYDLIKDILSIDDRIKLFLPDLKDLGGLYSSSNVNNIFNFLKTLPEIDYLIVSLDTIAYGGLITSRRCEDDFNIIKNRIEEFKNITSKITKNIFAFSSIMRISNNSINEEEKKYWTPWGKKIFDWSYNFHKNGIKEKTDIPKEILDDYLTTRKRNFEINKIYLNWAKEGFFNTLIFSKDDCAEFGLNVKEAQELENLINENQIQNALIKTGADEIPLSLISRALTQKEKIKINPIFIEDKSINLISKYEDISVKNCVLGQLNIANLQIDNNDFDLTFLINNFKKEQGDLVLGDVINSIEYDINFPKTSYFIADINNANGADVNFIKQLFKQNLNNFYGYCAYNTSANTIGCVILCAIVKFLSFKNNSYNDNNFKKLQFIRLLDDWAYQAISRKYIKESAPEFNKALNEKKEELNLNSKEIVKFLNYKPKNIEYSLPWNRSFEIRIKLIK